MTAISLCWAAVFVLSSMMSDAAVLFKYLDPDGHLIISNVPAPKTYPKTNRKRYWPIVLRASQTTQLQSRLLEAIITNESNWENQAVSNRGAQGLMQLMPGTAKNWGVSNAFDPGQNIEAGARYFKYLLTLFDGDVRLALAAYHAGENRVIKDGKIPAIRATQAYVQSVLKTYAHIDH